VPAPVFDAVMDSIQFIYSLEKYVAPTVVLVPKVVPETVAKFAESVGQDYDTVSFLLGLLVCYPLGIIMNMIPYGKMRHAFSFLLGAFLLQFSLDVEWIHQMITSLIAYAMLALLPRSTSKWLVPTFAMVYMSAAHLHRQFVNYLGYDMDFTSAQMVLTMKLYMFAYNFYDGGLIKEGKPDRAAKKCAPFAVIELPSIIEFLGFTFCFSNLMAGPAFEFSAYAAACNGSLLYDKDGKPRGKIPSNFLPTLIPLIKSFIILGLFVVGSGKFPLLDPEDPQNALPVIITPEFLANPWLYRIGYSLIGLFFLRFKYYFAWVNAEGANNLWYAGFEGFTEDGEAQGWDIACNIDVLAFETAPSIKILSAAWNKKTANWLSRYVYIRTNGSLVATYGLSAFWHGFYPGYYFFFLTVPLLTMCERVGKKKLSSRFNPSGKKWTPWGIVNIIATTLMANYAVLPFPMLAFEWSIAVWKSHYFAGHILAVAFYILMQLVPSPKKKSD